MLPSLFDARGSLGKEREGHGASLESRRTRTAVRRCGWPESRELGLADLEIQHQMADEPPPRPAGGPSAPGRSARSGSPNALERDGQESAGHSPRKTKPKADVVGSWDWCETTNGRLRVKDKARLLASAAATTSALAPSLLRSRLFGWHRPSRPLAVKTLHVPATPAAARAKARCAELSPQFMVVHCERTYWFSRMLGVRWGLAFDDEVLYVSAMLHDAALMDGFKGRLPEDHCFTIPTARDARELVHQVGGWSDERTLKVMEAITYNPNPYVHAKDGVEAHLLNAGVLIEVTGMRLWEMHPDDVRDLLDMAPRKGFKRGVLEIFDKEAHAHPGCRFALAGRWMFFRQLVRWAPFKEQ